MFQFGSFQGRIVASRELPGRPARTAEVPADLAPVLREALAERGIERLYTHQAEAWRRARAGEDLVVTTGTASGKSLAFLLPVLQAVVEDPAARVLLLYPTKALAQDQLRGSLALAEGLGSGPGGARPIEMGVYDGDTPPAERLRLREHANLILTNPDMLHAGLLPAHGRPGYAHLFRNLRYVVIDELHVYRGAFGAHVANLLRRLLRVCRHYGAEPRFLCSSATIANPGELAAHLCQRPVSVVSDDGSPAGGKTIHFWQPPLLPDGTRRPATRELAELLPELVRSRSQTIAFCRSRKETEVVLKEARDHLARAEGGHDESDLIAAYRGGYTPEERRQVERDLLEGRLLGVVSTNALELGIDIGQLEVVVQAGFPGTRASFWQQLGRAGRRGRQAHGVLVLATHPTDQFLVGNPGWLLDQAAEHAVVDPDCLSVQLAHARAAAAELPLTLDDARWFPDLGEIIPLLEEAGELRAVYGAWHWSGPAFPAGSFGLRAGDPDRFKVVDRRDGTTLTEMTRPQAYREAHPRAIYLHAGQEYLVEELDLVGHRAVVVPVEQNIYTQPDVRTHIEVLAVQEQRQVGSAPAWLGDVRVHDTVVGYKMLEFHTHQNLGYERLHEELTTRLETEAVWILLPERIVTVLGEGRLEALRGMVHALRAAARLRTMAERSDLLATSFTYAPVEQGAGTALIAYDATPGGMGFAAKAYDHLEQVLRDAHALVAGCTCQRGCPACVGDYQLERARVAWALGALLEPEGSAAPAGPPARARVPCEELSARWAEVRAELVAAGGGVFSRVSGVRLRGRALVLEVDSAGLARLLGSAGELERLRELLTTRVSLPEALRLRLEVPEEAREEAGRTRLKLRHRHDDLAGEPPADEREANARLASGYALESEA